MLMVHLDRTGKRNGRSEMSVGAFQERRDGAALIIRGDRRMLSLARRDAQDPLLQKGQLPRIEQPFEEIRRPEMNHGQSRPVENLFGDETVSTGVAGGGAICRPLGEVDGDLDARFLRGLNEVHHSWDEVRLHRPDEVGRIDSFHRCADGVDLEEITAHDLRAELLQRF
jgi:hypothetical protein